MTEEMKMMHERTKDFEEEIKQIIRQYDLDIEANAVRELTNKIVRAGIDYAQHIQNDFIFHILIDLYNAESKESED